MMSKLPTSTKAIQKAIDSGTELPKATQNYPSRGQTTIQKLYQTRLGKLFLKQVSKRNHDECQIKPRDGSLAEREFWAYKLAHKLKLVVPDLVLMDVNTTVQAWFDMNDARIYSTYQGPLKLQKENVFDCGVFDWLTGQVDRHDANYLYDFVKEQIILIDSAHSFLKYEGSLPDYLRFFEVAYPQELAKPVSSLTFSLVKKLKPNQLSQIVPLRNKDEADALVLRLEKIKSVRSIQDIIQLYRGNS